MTPKDKLQAAGDRLLAAIMSLPPGQRSVNTGRRRMTGATVCRLLIGESATQIAVGHTNEYRPGDMLVVLEPSVAYGSDIRAYTLAAHEAGHVRQHRAIGWLCPVLRWVLLGLLWLEWDASRRARALLTAHGLTVDETALRASWRGYLVPAIWQTALMLAMIGGASMVRR